MTGELESPIQSVLYYIEQRTIRALEHQERSTADRIFAKSYPILWWQIFNALIVLARATHAKRPSKIEQATTEATKLITKLLPDTRTEERTTELHFAYAMLAYVQQETPNEDEYHLRSQHLSFAQLELIYLTDEAIKWIRDHH